MDAGDEWLERTQPVLEYIDSRLRRKRTAIDVGAAEGRVTAWMAERFRRVHAFEPSKEGFALLSQARWPAHVTCHKLALGDRIERRHMAGKRHSAFVGQPADDGIEVRTLDSFEIPDIDLIKIDVEGFETRVIVGALGVIARCRPMIMFEHKKFWQTRYNDENPRAVLERHGYRRAFKGHLDTVMIYKPPK